MHGFNWLSFRKPDMPLPATENRRLKARDGLFLLAAIALHSLLFLIPLKRETLVSDSPDVVRITLSNPVVNEPEIRDDHVPETLPDLAADEPANVAQTRQSTPTKRVSQAQPAQRESDEAPVPDRVVLHSTAFLMSSISDIEWSEPPAQNTRQLGVLAPQDPAEGRRFSLDAEPNIFEGMFLPNKTEIVDRWLASDGSHNVVINTPGGETLCGRGMAWDPMQPLVEHVMQFRFCGGGGKRSFEMPARASYTRDRGQVANSTTN